MMKRIIVSVLLMISFISSSYSQDFPINYIIQDPFFFYIPSQEEVNDYFNFYSYLQKLDNNEAAITDTNLNKLYKRFVNKETMHSLLFESFLLQTKNENIENLIIKLRNVGILVDDFSEILFRKYKSNKNVRETDSRSTIQYNYNDKYFDENINLFTMRQSSTFNKKLGLMLYSNDWVNMSFNDDSKKDDNEDSFYLNFGGGTNSMFIALKEYKNIEFSDLYAKAVEDEYNKNKYINWKTIELDAEGILAISGADKIFIGYGSGPDIIPEIKNASFKIILYNSIKELAYEVTYFMNFSKINNNYLIRNRIWNQLFMQLNFIFIKSDEVN